MNQNYIHTITLYNRIQATDSEDKREHWQRTVLHNCFWKSEVKTSFSGTQASVQNTYVARIPLWKNQMVISLGIADSQKAMEAQRKVTDMTNQLLQKNADMLKMATVETAKESERGIVDIETLKYTNQSLISTLDEVLQIQTDGAKKRQEAETELRRIEGELKQKLLEVRQVN